MFQIADAIAAHQPDAAAEYSGLHARLLQQLRKLAGVAEGVGQIADFADIAETLRHAGAPEHVAYIGFAAGEIGVLQYIPRSNLQPAFANQPFQQLALLGADFQIVLHGNHLTVEVITGILLCLQKLQHAVHQRNQTSAMLFKWHIPFAIPVGVGNDVGSCFHLADLLRSHSAQS